MRSNTLSWNPYIKGIFKFGLLMLLVLPSGALAGDKAGDRNWRSMPSEPGEGLFTERLNQWRQGRMWHMVDAEDEYLLSGFESRPGIHPWQGEHVGKWLHAATLAYEQTGDKALLKALQKTVKRLMATQDANGYMGTYAYADTFMAMPENVSILEIADDIAPQKKKSKGGWDTWTLRYNIYGLLTYERFHPNPNVVEACKRMGDLLIEVYGAGKYDLTKYGTRQGISATTLLESIMMLYERTGEKKYLEFAEHIVVMSENNPKLRLMGQMLDERDVVFSGDGKAYQLMANLLGYLRLYESTDDERYLRTVLAGWKRIMKDHTLVTGGPWSQKMDYNGNRECFALKEDFDPLHADVETCSTTTWVQLNLHLLEMTGESKYAAEAERVVFNALIAAQYKEGIDWCYYTMANQGFQPYEERISCCASSGPRALEMFAHHLIGEVDGVISFASLVPNRAILSESYGKAEIQVTGDFPNSPSVVLRFDQAEGKRFPVEFRDPSGARLESVRINGKAISVEKNKRGFYTLNRNWKTGDAITINFEYLLESHFEFPKDGKKWVAFTYGPWALAAETSKGDVFRSPLLGKDIPSKAAAEWLKPCPNREGSLPEYCIKNTEIVLKPFFATGSLETGPNTYFQF